jgi:hypothetical protein
MGKPMAERFIVDAVMRLVSEVAPEAFEGIKKYRRRMVFARLIDKAIEWGMTDPRDMTIFCAIQLNAGPAFFESAHWQAAARKVRRGEMTWAVALDTTLKQEEENGKP